MDVLKINGDDDDDDEESKYFLRCRGQSLLSIEPKCFQTLSELCNSTDYSKPYEACTGPLQHLIWHSTNTFCSKQSELN